MAEINKRNLVDETAEVYAENTLASNPTPLFSTGLPAKIMRASIANTNLLSEDGDLFVGTGSTYTETIDGTEYTYAKIAKKNQSKLFVDGLNSTAKNVGLAANVGKIIDDRLYLTGSKSTTDAIGIGSGANAGGHSSIALGVNAVVSPAGTNSIQLGGGTNETAMSFQVGNHQMLNLNTGKIPLNRINESRHTSLVLGSNQDEGGSIYGNTIYGIGAKIPTANGDATVIGRSAEASSWGVAVGAEAYCKGTKNVVIGYGATLGVKNENIGIDNCIAIGAEAKIENSAYIKKTAIQLGTGTNSAGGFQVWDYQLMNSDGIIPLDRRPTYRCKLTKQVTVGGGSGAATRTYVFEWYSSSSSKEGAIFDNFSVFGYEEKVISSISTNTYNLYNAILKITKNATIDESVTTIYVDDDTNTAISNGKLSEFTFTAQLI